jgi:diguanylate cyclase (GGDEF)-like protein/PAS domain S-box-containing protein
VAGTEVAVSGTEAGALQGLAGGQLERLLAAAVEAADAGVSIADAARPGFPLVYVNPGFERLTGYRAEDVLGRGCGFLQTPDTDPSVVAEVGAALRTGRGLTAVLRNATRAGATWWNELQLAPVRDASGAVTHVVGFQRDVTARVDAEQRAAHLATHDVVTGLPDRARLVDAVELELLRARYAGSGLAVLVVELEGLRDLDVEHGYAARDLVLAAVALRLRSVLRCDDVLGRLSGDEFVAVLPGVRATSVTGVAARVADAVRSTFAAPLDVPGLRLHLRCGVGVAVFPDAGEDVAGLLTAARRALRRG